MVELVVQARKAAHGAKPVLVHCWRGGMRSQSVGWLLKTAGFEPSLLTGGYKAFRAHARTYFDRPWRLQVVSGLTGAGKTRVLQLLADAGEQILDLEGLANHRGSAFGGIGQAVQPSTEQFENELFMRLSNLDPLQRIWVEDEGNRIGTIVLPKTFYDLMRHSPAVFLDSSSEHRIENLLEDYGDLPTSELAAAIEKIRKRLGPQHANEAIIALQSNQVDRAIEIVLAYYDKTYYKAVKNMPRKEVVQIPIDDLSDDALVSQTIDSANAIQH